MKKPKRDAAAKAKSESKVVSTENYFLIKTCPCGHQFGPSEKFTMTTTQVSWFRGEDEVKIECQKCRPIR
jgi:hypothetical protein